MVSLKLTVKGIILCYTHVGCLGLLFVCLLSVFCIIIVVVIVRNFAHKSQTGSRFHGISDCELNCIQVITQGGLKIPLKRFYNVFSLAVAH